MSVGRGSIRFDSEYLPGIAIEALGTKGQHIWKGSTSPVTVAGQEGAVWEKMQAPYRVCGTIRRETVRANGIVIRTR